MAVNMHKTKEQNTFRFKSFANRVNEIDLRRLALYHIGHENEQLEETENETYFYQTLKKWMVLNLSEEFSVFSRKCTRIITLPQLIHQKDVVIDALLDRLATASNLSLQPLLELLYVLARDLREEFYPYFQRVLDRLICLLNTQDAEQLEWTFVCLAYLFKALKPYLKRNIGVVFNTILPLLDEQRYEEHITNFAVECFSYIARDVRDYKKFLDFVLDTVEREQVQSVQGCGRLLFEIIRGVQGQFHSSAAEFLEFIFNSLIDVEAKRETQILLLGEIVKYTIDQVLKFINKEHIDVYWTKLCAVANKIESEKQMKQLVPLFLSAASYRNGRHLTEMDLVVPVILKLIDRSANDKCVATLTQLSLLVSKIIVSGSTQVTQLDTSRLIKRMLDIKQRDVYDEFVLLIVMHPQFELLAFPIVIDHFEKQLDRQSIELLVRIVLKKQPLAVNAIDMEHWRQYTIYLKQQSSVDNFLHSFNNFNNKHNDVDLWQQYLLLCILAPHIKTLKATEIEMSIVGALKSQVSNLEAASSKPDSKQPIEAISLLYETAVHQGYELVPKLVEQCLHVLLPHIDNLRALSCIDQLLYTRPKLFDEQRESITKQLVALLTTHHRSVRLTVSHCLKTLHKKMASKTPYTAIFAAAKIEPNLYNYREQLLQLQQLETGGVLFKKFSAETHYKCDVVRFLLGMLYQNFKLVWEPSLELLEQYAKNMTIAEFWPICRDQLEATAKSIELSYETHNAMATKENVATSHWASETLNTIFNATDDSMAPLSQQELLNYRNLLWQRLPKFGQIVELKNRELVPLFFNFLENEYRKHFESREHTCNLLAYTTTKTTDDSLENDANDVDSDIDDDDEDDDDDDDNAEQRSKKKQQKKRKPKSSPIAKCLQQTLLNKMGIFSVQPNPKALYREPALYALYMELLASSNPLLQKQALSCILAYKNKALLAHKEQLYSLIDELKFKNELLQLQLTEIDNEQRVDLMPILLRLLYGKMLTRSNQRTISPQVRKSLIMRFLAQCTKVEIITFLQMAFGRFEKYTAVEMDLTNVAETVRNEFQLSAVTSPKKLKSMVNLLELLRKEFGGIMDADFHLYMLKILVFVGSTSQAVLDAATTLTTTTGTPGMHPKMPLVFRNLKSAALLSMVNFLTHIDNFEWTTSQLSCLTEVFVWPTISRLPQECIHTPTPLLKLLLEWGQQTRFLGCLNATHPTEHHVILHYMIELLLNERAKGPVQKPIMTLVERLLTLASDSAVDEASVETATEALSLIKPFIPRILQRLSRTFNVQRRVAQLRRIKLDKQQLNILSLLTKHVDDNETCDNLLKIMLPVLVFKCESNANDETLMSNVIITVSNLIKRLDAPETYLMRLAPLFEYVQCVNARKLLCNLIVDIATKRLKEAKQQPNIASPLCAQLKETTRIVLMMNAWDKRWLEQPDYDQRLDALKAVTTMVNNNEAVTLELGALVIYNCCYYLRFDKDMGLRDNASEHLQLLLPKLTTQFANEPHKVNFLVGDIFMNLTRRLIREPNDNARNEGIRLLGAMARQCPSSHATLGDLSPLCDQHDEEVDFFANLTHLQSQRHGRALLKFCNHAATLTTAPATRTLTEFILPLASRYVLQEKYASKHTLVDAAIETIGVVCQLLPWQHYLTILRYYLQKMRSSHDYQKQCVRIVVRILDAFHFDLTQAKQEQQQPQQPSPSNVEQQKENENEVENVADDDTENVDELESELADALDDADDADDTVTATAATIEIVTQPLVSRPTLLSFCASRRILSTITSILIPTLNRAITERSHYDTQHKVNRRRVGHEREEEEILRVPIALALVKLMQKLPKELMDHSLPGVFMKVCTFLRSPLKSVRMLTRDILKKIMLTLGSSYLPLLVEHLQSLLTRGFQVHVLSVTIHGVLDALRGKFQAGDIDNCLGNLLEVALNDIFGDIAAEKEVQKIAKNTPEAKPTAKSFLTLHIAARNIQEACLLDLLLPFKAHLARTHARKQVLKIQECFAKIVSGLAENPYITRESLLVFIYGMISESITDLLPGLQKQSLTTQQKEQMRRARTDCFIIQPTPQRRVGAVNKNVKTNAQANAHILIEFGLELLHIVLKRKKLADMNYQPFLNPMLPLLRDALKSNKIRVTTFTLKCFATIWNNEYALDDFVDSELSVVVARMFEILKNLSTFGASKQEDNLQLIKATLKAMVALLRQCTRHKLTPEQIEQLVLHIEQDLFESDKQVISFALLKALVARRIDTPAVHDILKQISELTITSHSDYVRLECRNILLGYIMDYAPQKRVVQLLKHFSVQLCYTVPSGRMSAIEFLAAIVKRFPQSLLGKHAEFLYLSLGTRLVNDDDTTCRKAVAECVESLLSRLEKADRARLYEITLLFFEASSQKPSVREMAASLCSRFLNVEKHAFVHRLPQLMPLIVARLSLNEPQTRGKFVRAPTTLQDNEVDAEELKKQKKMKLTQNATIQETENAIAAAVLCKQRAIDHEIIQIQYCVHKILENCAAEIFTKVDETLLGYVDELAYTSQRLLAHAHAWVRCNAAKVISQILAHYDFALVGERLCTPNWPLKSAAQHLNFIYAQPLFDIKSLVLDLCAQMSPGDTPPEMIEEMSKIFLLIANMLRNVPFAVENQTSDVAEDFESTTKIHLKWLMGRIRHLINKEIAKAPHCVSVRTAMFNLIEGFITIVPSGALHKLAPTMLLVLVREMSEDNEQIDMDLRQLALHVGSRLRKSIGTDVYDKLRANAQTSLLMRRAARKKLLAQEKIQDPVRAAKRKISTQERKKVAKKRKADVMRGRVVDVKQKLKKRKRKAESGDLF